MSETERFETTADDVVDDRSFGQKFKDGVNRIWCWCGDHKEAILISTPFIAGAVKELIKAHNSNQRIRAEDEKHMRTIYDASHKHWIVTAKDIKPKQQRIIDARHDAGESYYDILDDLGIKVIR